MPKLRLRKDAPPGAYSVGGLSGEWQPGDERPLSECIAWNVDQSAFLPITDDLAQRLVDNSGGVLEIVPDAAPTKNAKE